MELVRSLPFGHVSGLSFEDLLASILAEVLPSGVIVPDRPIHLIPFLFELHHFLTVGGLAIGIVETFEDEFVELDLNGLASFALVAAPEIPNAEHVFLEVADEHRLLNALGSVEILAGPKALRADVGPPIRTTKNGISNGLFPEISHQIVVKWNTIFQLLAR